MSRRQTLTEKYGDLSTDPCDVVECLLYHTHDEDMHRYRYKTVRRGGISRRGSSEAAWYGTPELSEAENAHLHCIALDKKLIHKQMHNYHPEKDKEYQELHARHATAYEASVKPIAVYISPNERRYTALRNRAKRLGITLPTYKQRNTVDPAVKQRLGELLAEQESLRKETRELSPNMQKAWERRGRKTWHTGEGHMAKNTMKLDTRSSTNWVKGCRSGTHKPYVSKRKRVDEPLGTVATEVVDEHPADGVAQAIRNQALQSVHEELQRRKTVAKPPTRQEAAPPPEPEVVELSESESDTPPPGKPFDWATAKVGLLVWARDKDGFWLKARFTSVGYGPGYGVDRAVVSVMVHFNGWGKRYDEYLKRADDEHLVRSLDTEPPPDFVRKPPPPPPREEPRYGSGTHLDLDHETSEDEEGEAEEAAERAAAAKMLGEFATQ